MSRGKCPCGCGGPAARRRLRLRVRLPDWETFEFYAIRALGVFSVVCFGVAAFLWLAQQHHDVAACRARGGVLVDGYTPGSVCIDRRAVLR